MFKHKWMFLIPSLFQILLSYQFGLGVDEAHYMLYAKYIDWSYFDHPPLVGWFHIPFNFIFGWNEIAARLPAIILGYVATLLVYDYLRGKKYSDDACVAGALSLNVSFLIFALHLFLLPDTFLITALFLLIRFTENIAKKNKLHDWIYLGLTLGFMGLAKYTSVLFVVPVVWYLVQKKFDNIWKEKGLYLSVLVAGLIISPVILWNSQHEWISFKYQFDHVLGDKTFNPVAFLVSLAGQIGAYNPLLFPLAVYGFWKCYKFRNNKYRLEFYILSVLLLFFIKSSFGEPILPHWTAPFFALALPIGVVDYWKKFFQVAAFTWLIYFLIHSEFALHWLPGVTPAYRDIWGYNKVAEEVVASTNPKTLVGVTNWTYASRMMFYLREKRDVVVLDDRKDQFDLWQKQSPEGKDVMIVMFSFDNEDPQKFPCRSREKRGSMRIDVKDNEVYTVHFLLCRGYH